MSALQHASDELDRGFAAGLIPFHMHDGVAHYVLKGIPPGDFMRLVLCNDFMGAAGRADEENQRALFEWCRFLYNYVPGRCRGSPEAYSAWIAQGGMEGMGQ